MDIVKILEDYDFNNISIGVLGGHSALDVCDGAKRAGFRTVAVCQKGREETYTKHYKSEGDRGCVDEVIVVDNFADIVKPEVQERLRELSTIFIHNRYFWVYCNFDEIEKDFHVPIFGSREMVRLEERDVEHNQYWLLEQAGIRIPKMIRREPMSEEELRKTLDDHFVINQGGPLIVKASEAERKYERAFFIINSEHDYFNKSEEMLKAGIIDRDGLEKATIEEFVIGAQVNFNYFYSVLHDRLELMGTDARRQTSLDGFLRLDAATQIELLKSGYRPSMVETGHFSVTTKESLLEKIFDIGQRFVETTQEHVHPGIIGPFALQGAVAADKGREELVIFDVSMRIPGSPGTRFTPHTSYLWGHELSYGDRIAMELRDALDAGRLSDLLT